MNTARGAVRPLYAQASGSPIRAMLALAGREDMISLAGGHPDPALLPIEWLRESLLEVTGKLQGRSLQYGATEGQPELREASAALLTQRGLTATAAELIITTGSQQAIDLLARVLIEPGEGIAVESFNYPAALQAFRFAGARLIEVPTDAQGMDVDRLEPILLTERPRVLYVVPNFANPTGAVMPLARRLRLLELAAQYDVTLIEDDPYGELWFGEAPPPPLVQLNQRADSPAQVTYMTSYSKVVAPALRLGVLLAPADIQRAVVLAKQAADVHSGSLEQLKLSAMLGSNCLTPHLDVLRKAYAAKSATLADALRRHADGLLKFDTPQGGMFVWARLRSDLPLLPTQDWVDFGLQHKVLVVPGAAFSISNAAQPWLRLSFANPSPASLQQGAERLGRGLQGLASRTSSNTKTTPERTSA
ncbi:MAG: PLP-dependent aminotransferase family protein [Polaromonas sp.]|uniref:aminotransferase-like domain-containing protein n=1 Tax=Polaromonas sp. TaxID=1869339 RepID=UPI003266E522